MQIDVFIARWIAVFWLISGLSHVLHPAKWGALLRPLRERETGGFILAAMSLPLGLTIILGHNTWVWGLPVIVTVAGWMGMLKSVIYLLFPRAHVRVMPSDARMAKGIRIVGGVMLVLGALTAYDSFYRR